MISKGAILEICHRQRIREYYVVPLITKRQIKKIRQFYTIPKETDILAIYATGMFKLYQYGIVICSDGIYKRGKSINNKDEEVYYSWEEYGNLFPADVDEETIRHFFTDFIFTYHFRFTLRKIVQVLLDLYYYVRAEIEFQKKKEWYLAIRQQISGPYHEQTVENFIRNHHIKAKDCLVWKKGMAEWKALDEISEFREILNTLKPNDREFTDRIPQ